MHASSRHQKNAPSPRGLLIHVPNPIQWQQHRNKPSRPLQSKPESGRFQHRHARSFVVDLPRARSSSPPHSTKDTTTPFVSVLVYVSRSPNVGNHPTRRVFVSFKEVLAHAVSPDCVSVEPIGNVPAFHSYTTSEDFVFKSNASSEVTGTTVQEEEQQSLQDNCPITFHNFFLKEIGLFVVAVHGVQ